MVIFRLCQAYETGKISSLEFADNIVEEFKFSVTPNEFLEGFAHFSKGLYHGAEELLQKLSKKYSVATLSNTNEIHWNRLCNEHNFEELVRNNYLSFRTGYMKPDKEAYLTVIEELNYKTDKIIFFDDNKINVEAARDIGIEAVLVNGFQDLKEKIIKMKIL